MFYVIFIYLLLFKITLHLITTWQVYMIYFRTILPITLVHLEIIDEVTLSQKFEGFQAQHSHRVELYFLCN
jgi:hypothetical protein